MKQDNLRLLSGKSKCSLGKKGFILTLDLILGITIVFLVVIITLFFVSQGSAISLSEYQLSRIGSDIVTVMSRNYLFDALDHSSIETKMEELLPGNYEMLLRVQGDFSVGNGTIEVGAEIPEKRLIVSGQRVALTRDETYLMITYWVWLR